MWEPTYRPTRASLGVSCVRSALNEAGLQDADLGQGILDHFESLWITMGHLDL